MLFFQNFNCKNTNSLAHGIFIFDFWTLGGIRDKNLLPIAWHHPYNLAQFLSHGKKNHKIIQSLARPDIESYESFLTVDQLTIDSITQPTTWKNFMIRFAVKHGVWSVYRLFSRVKGWITNILLKNTIWWVDLPGIFRFGYYGAMNGPLRVQDHQVDNENFGGTSESQNF